MATMRPGRGKERPLRRTKGGTESTRNHVFKGFSQRVAQLKIEPVRRGRSTLLDDAELDATFSYFRNAFVEWKELNMSEAFTSFARQVAPLCDSLPQVLHHSDRIVDLLVEYMGRGEKFSQEPLLSLTAHLAHDLGEKFEGHFERIVRVVSQLAATHPDVEVIEWSFGCLAWLFKYLSRLLIPDLRPVFDLMSPLLGKERQKPFVARFAAESLSFLIRKAAAGHQGDAMPLKLIIKYISDQIKDSQCTSRDYEFEQGLMYLFADSLKGVQRGFHSSAVVILRELLTVVYGVERDRRRHRPLEPIVLGVLTASIHHTDAKNFKPLLEVLLAQISSASSSVYHLSLSSRLIFTVCGVRKGDRIDEWNPVFSSIQTLLDSAQELHSINSADIWDFLSALSVVFQYCALEAAMPHEKLLGRLTQGPWESFFLHFCSAFADLGSERFHTCLLPYFKRFIIQKAHERIFDLCTILPHLKRNGTLSAGALPYSQQCEALFVDPFDDLKHSTPTNNDSRQIYFCNSLLSIISFLQMPEDQLKNVFSCLEKLFERAMNVKDTSLTQVLDIFATGHGFQFLVEQSHRHQAIIDPWPALCRASVVYGRSLTFWNALAGLLRREKQNLCLKGSHMEDLKQALMLCLHSPSHDLRNIAISVLEIMQEDNEILRNMASITMLVEQQSLGLVNQRAITMLIEKLAMVYTELCSNEWIGMIVPAFCFGLLHVRLASVWDDACQALKAMSETKEGEVFITSILSEWLKMGTAQRTAIDNAVVATPQRRYMNEFQCINLVALQEHFTKTRTYLDDSETQLRISFNEQHVIAPIHNSFCRTQALRLLNILPHLAERKSRVLVPFICEWVFDYPENPEDSVDTSEAAPQASQYWTMGDKKSLLSVFAQFTNPRMLHRAAELQEALLTLMCHGDDEIQKLALKTLLTWKNPAIHPYQEHLLSLLDDARFRDELAFFLTPGGIHQKDLEQMLPIVLRLLYGKVVAGKQGYESQRKSVFIGVQNIFGHAGVNQFLSIAMGSLSGISIVSDSMLNEELLNRETIDARRQVGILNLLDNLLSVFGTSFTPFIAEVVDSLLYCGIKATRHLSNLIKPDGENDESASSKISLFKTVRQRTLQVLAGMFEICPEFPWQPYMFSVMKELIEPRLLRFPIETAQSVSGLLRLFSAWSKSPLTALFLIDYNQEVLVKTIDCLGVSSAKDEVKSFVLNEIFRKAISLVAQSKESATEDMVRLQNRVQKEILERYSNPILIAIRDILHQNPQNELLESSIQTIADLAPHVAGSSESQSMIEIATFLLRQPSKRVGHRTKLGLLRIIREFIQRCEDSSLNLLFENLFETVCPLFTFIQDKKARSMVCDILQDLSKVKNELKPIASLCNDLNSFSTIQMDRPDFDRRLRAFDVINGEKTRSYTLTQWKPVVNNMLHFIKDNDELSVRVNASISLRRFIDSSRNDEFRAFIKATVLPGIRRGTQEASELVRIEYLCVLEHLVKTHHDWSPVADLHILLSDHEESSFFSNILHIQNHRRIRALRRLAAHSSNLQSRNIFQLLIPLLEHFILNKADDDGADGLLGEAIKTLASLTQGMEWSQFRSLCKRYIGYLGTKEDIQKPMIKLITGLIDGLNVAGRAKGYVKTSVPAHENFGSSDSAEVAGTVDVVLPLSTLAKTLPQQEKLNSDLMDQIFPGLTKYLHKKDEATVSLRVPIATAITKALILLPPYEIESKLPGMLLDICYILKSRAQESRDMSRNTLSDIAAILGPAYLGFLLKALQTALQRGYQLHVLSFTLHHVLVKLSSQMSPGDLDYCLSNVVDVIMDDIFGATGQEKEADEYISKMKEVKSSKSFDSMDLLARSATTSSLIKLVIPLRSLLTEKLNAKMVHKIDELLRRIGLGILQNPTINNRDLLVFCYELVQEVYAATTTAEKTAEVHPKNKRYLITQRSAVKSGARLPTSSYLYKLIRFALDTLRTVMKKHDELKTPQNLAGFLPMIGDAMVQGQEEVQVSAIRLLTLVVKVPLKEFDSSCAVYIDEALRAVKGALSPNTELAQTALKLISAIMRERPNVQIKERDIGSLIKRSLPDLDQPDRSGATFGLLKAVINRQLHIPEIYEAMDKVAEIMITNQTKTARDIARNHYFQFLTSYTQNEKRFRKQMDFLLRNLQYEHPEGRISVMEALELILSKALPRFSDRTQYEYHGVMFLPLVNVVANDNVSKCRELASLLVKRLFQHASDTRLHNFIVDLKAWLEQDDNVDLKRLSIQCWGFYLESMGAEEGSIELPFVMHQLDAVMDYCLTRRQEGDWELLYFSLALLLKVSTKHTETLFSSSKEGLWTAVQVSASYPHAWVKLKAAELMATFFRHLGASNKDTGLQRLPLEGSSGLQLAEQNMIQLCNAFVKNLQDPNTTEKLCTQSVKNVAFLARCFAANAAKWKWQETMTNRDGGVVNSPEILDHQAADADTSSPESDSEALSFAHQLSGAKRSNKDPPTAIHHLTIRLSGIVRRDTTPLKAKSVTMSLLENMVANLPLESLATSLPHLLSMIHTLTDSATSVPRVFTQNSAPNQDAETYKHLSDQMRETMNTLQKRMGAQDYLKVMNDVQKAARKRRDERRMKRKIEAVADPEKWERDKKRRNDNKRSKRKERGLENRGRRRGW